VANCPGVIRNLPDELYYERSSPADERSSPVDERSTPSLRAAVWAREIHSCHQYPRISIRSLLRPINVDFFLIQQDPDFIPIFDPRDWHCNHFDQ